jgi:hypothetical protein
MIKLLDKGSNWKFILPFFILFCLFTFYVFPSYQSQLVKIVGEQIKPLDTRFSYSLSEVNRLFHDLGTEGRELYATIAGRVDMVYPIVYGALFILVLAYLFKKLSGHKSKLILIALFPILGMLFDYLENFNVLNLLKQYPNINEQQVALCELFTRIKHIVLFGAVGTVLISTVILLIKTAIKKGQTAGIANKSNKEL